MGDTRYESGTMPSNYTYTGQYSHTKDFGLMFYNARWYDPSLGRFTSADTIVPGGVQGYDRYAYSNNNPIKYTDPSGHESKEPCGYYGGSYCSTSVPTPLPTTSTSTNNSTEILVCGHGAGPTCEDTTEYGGQRPLGIYDNIVPNQNALWIGVDDCNNGSEKYCAAMKIYNQVANNPGSHHLVGHSAGGSSVIWAVRMLQDAGYGNRIASITLLDPARDGQWNFDTGNGSISVNIFDMANEIVSHGNNVFVGDYPDGLDGPDDDITGLGNSNYAKFIPPDGSTIDGHYLLAISNDIFNKAAGYWEWQK